MKETSTKLIGILPLQMSLIYFFTQALSRALGMTFFFKGPQMSDLKFRICDISILLVSFFFLMKLWENKICLAHSTLAVIQKPFHYHEIPHSADLAAEELNALSKQLSVIPVQEHIPKQQHEEAEAWTLLFFKF